LHIVGAAGFFIRERRLNLSEYASMRSTRLSPAGARAALGVLVAATLFIPASSAIAQRGGGGRGGGGGGNGAVQAGGPSAGNDSAAGGAARRPGFTTPGSASRDIVAMTEAAPTSTHHSVNVRGQTIAYTATAGMLPIRNEQTDAVEGGMYYVSYTKDGANPSTRPITFAFNGGPGSATVWLHLGAFGPKKVKLNADGTAPPPPYTFEDNPNTLLDQTDLVFIDAVGTGYSRAATQALGARFWGLDEDLNSFREFIRLYLTRFDRMASPKFLAGESYGTTRASGLSGLLADDGIALNGVVLLSSVLNFGYSSQVRGNDIGFINFIPTYTATAWYHKKLPADLQKQSIEEVTAAAEKWSVGDYAAALMKGNKLTAAERQATIDQMARFTGLPKEIIDQNDLRVALGTFDSELMRDQHETVGRLDGRFTGFAPLSGGRGGGAGVGDPSDISIRNTFTPVLTDYTRRELNYRNEDTYYILGGGIGRWNYPQNSYATVVPNLERAFAKNSYMKLYVAEGYYDAATPYWAVEYTLSHLSIDPKVAKNNITVGKFTAGHMMYIDEPSMKKLRADLEKFYNNAVKEQVVP
jgi:carboxypeptidase C (cathepsin A)